MTIHNTKSKFLLKHGEAIWYSFYSYPNGSQWIVRYKGKYYKITHDGTGNEFFCSQAPREISEEEAKKILSHYEEAWAEAQKLWGWESLEEYFEKTL
ncbi:MAG: hypothetical protein QXY62_06285 [Candidatus Altiarchaeota archaeon]